MKPGDKISIDTTIGNLNGVVNGWDVNGIKVTLFDCMVTKIRWIDIYGMRIT